MHGYKIIGRCKWYIFILGDQRERDELIRGKLKLNKIVICWTNNWVGMVGINALKPAMDG